MDKNYVLHISHHSPEINLLHISQHSPVTIFYTYHSTAQKQSVENITAQSRNNLFHISEHISETICCTYHR
jgi:hypothetical protein